MLKSRLIPLLLLSPALAVIVLFFFVPFIMTLVISLRDGGGGVSLDSYAWFFRSAYVADLGFTLVIAAIASVLCLVIALPGALIVHRKLPGYQLLLVCSMLPLVVPHIMGAYAISLVYSPNGPLWGLLVNHLHLLDHAPELRNTVPGFLIALIWKFFPVAFLAQLSSLQSIPDELIEAARMQHSHSLIRFYRIQLPLMMPGILSGAVMTFIMAATQFSITLIVYADKMLNTIPIGIYFEVFGAGQGQARGSAMGVVLTASTLAILVLATILIRRANRETFRHA